MDYRAKLIKKEGVAEGTMSFYFTKPEGFEYKAGQSIDLTLLNPKETDEQGNTRAYSLSSAPYETELMITTRLRDTAFKRVIRDLEEGTEVKVEGPFGDMTLHNDHSKPALMLSGGIGLTPFYSIIKQAAHEKKPHKIFLFYSNRRPEDTPFLEELRKLEKENPNFKFIPTMTQTEKSSQEWHSEKGYINMEMVKRYLPEPNMAVAYLAGPADMVRTMRELSNSLGIDSDFIRTEEFTGY